MRFKATFIVSALAALTMHAQAATTFNAVNYSGSYGAGNGIGIVDSGLNLLDPATFYWTFGVFSGSQNFSTDSAASILGQFTKVADNIMTDTGFTPNGAINGGSTFPGGTSGSPGAYTGQTAYVVLGNASDIFSSTVIAVFNTGITFAAGDVGGNGSQSAIMNNATFVVYGVVGGQDTSTQFPVSVQLTSIPEPSAFLLCGLGGLLLLRRRRND